MHVHTYRHTYVYIVYHIIMSMSYKLSFLTRRDVDVVDDQTQWQRAIEEEVQEAR